MAELKGTNVAAPVVPFTSDDKYATHDAAYGKGGFRSVATIAERDAIPADRKTEGMVVRVQADKKHYVWESNAWAEWLPKGNVTVDTALNINSNNAVSNKAVTTGINTVTTAANAARTVADAAIPKSKIAAESGNIVSSDTTQVPSSKAISKLFTDYTESFNDILDALNIKVVAAQGTANAAIPKANIAQAVSGNGLRQDLVPSTKAVLDFVNIEIDSIPKMTVDESLSNTSVNPVQNKVLTIELSKMGSTIETMNDNININHQGITEVNREVQSHKSQITLVTNNLAPIKSAWDRKNAANGLVQLDAGGKLPAASLPAGYDNIDMLVAFVAANPTTGMTIGQKWYVTSTKLIFTATSATSGSTTMPEGDEKIYINTSLNKSYRWTGSDMVVVGDGSGIAIGTTASTAFRGDYGNTLYTNFGSGANLTNVQAARDFFRSINGSNENFFNDVNTTRGPESFTLNLYGKSFTGTNASTKSYPLQTVDANNAGIMTASMFNTLQELELQAFPLNVTASVSPTAVFEVGSSTLSPIAINVTRKGVSVNQSATIIIENGTGTQVSGILNAQKIQWTPSANITSNMSKIIKVTYGAQSKNVAANYTFKYKKYWGVSNKATLTNADVLAMAGSTWADSRTMGTTRFDCTGGKYPYYVIPANLYTGLEMWVGGLKNTDLVVTDMQVTNASGAASAYKVIRLNNKQTGVLSVEFK